MKRPLILIFLTFSFLIISHFTRCEKDCQASLWYADSDADGFGDPNKSLSDCDKPFGYVANANDFDDTNAKVHPGAEEIIDNALDDNGDGSYAYSFYLDNDNDGFGDHSKGKQIILTSSPISKETTIPDGYSNNNTDCDDSKGTIHPKAEELGQEWSKELLQENLIDENCNATYGIYVYLDADKDGYSPYVRSIDNGKNHASKQNLELRIVYELTIEKIKKIGQTDTWLIDDNQYTLQLGDLDDQDPKVYPNAPETPNNTIDEDGNGYYAYLLFEDSDNDGYGNHKKEVTLIELEHPIFDTKDVPDNFSQNNLDCNDNNRTIHPEAEEIADNAIDENCDGLYDFNLFKDEDNDGYGGASSELITVDYVIRDQWGAPEGYFFKSTDCNDSNSAINPGIKEIEDGIDNNCNGKIDEFEIPDNSIDEDDDGLYAYTLFIDNDHDNFGSAVSKIVEHASVITDESQTPIGFSLNSKDCDDDNANINPNVLEVSSDGVDNNCNGVIDETPEIPNNNVDEDGNGKYTYTMYVDNDNDGFGAANSTAQLLEHTAIINNESQTPVGYSLNNQDCDDNDSTANPNVPETNDGKDNNCDGIVDGVEIPDNHIDDNGDGKFGYHLYPDADNDNFGSSSASKTLIEHSTTIQSEVDAPNGYSLNNEDCNDTNANINPGETEISGDGIDNDCNGRCLKQTFQEDFSASIPASWITVNASNPKGTNDWYHDSSYGGVVTSNYEASTGTGHLNNWLISPVQTVRNGDTIKFWFIAGAQSPFYDRFQVRISLNGNSSVLPTLGDQTSVGDFTYLILDLNPDENPSTLSTSWVEQTITISGLPDGDHQALFGMRHFISGNVANLVSFDNFRIIHDDTNCN